MDTCGIWIRLLNCRVTSGKSTLAKLLLRILDFDKGNLFVNGIDIRRYDPVEYHRHITTVFQGFSKFNSTVKENIGVGDVQKMRSNAAIGKAINLAGAETIVDSLPHGLRTKLDTSGFGSTALPPFCNNTGSSKTSRIHHGLSGGEVCQDQRLVVNCQSTDLLLMIVATNRHLARFYESGSTRD
jgi:ABC-type glutathione transport system ATPase component